MVILNTAPIHLSISERWIRAKLEGSNIDVIRIAYNYKSYRLEVTLKEKGSDFTHMFVISNRRELNSKLHKYLNPWEEYDEWKRSTI